MIQEVYDKFKVINWLREQRPDKKYKNYFLEGWIEFQINKLKSEINEIAKEHDNSYVDDNGNTVWIKSEVKGE